MGSEDQATRTCKLVGTKTEVIILKQDTIIAPGNGYTGGHSWTQSSQGGAPSSDYLYMIHDPLKNTAMDIHEYLDSDFSGTYLNCSQSRPTRLAPLTAWLKTYGLNAMGTDSGGSNGTEGEGDIDGLVNYLADSEEYIGCSAWPAGPLWGTNSPCCTSGIQYGSLEPGSVASDGSPG